MGPKTFQLLVAIFVLYTIVPHTIESKPSENDPFGFIKPLEGCHKGQSIKGLKDLKRYMEKFGYLHYGDHKFNIQANNDKFDDLLEKAIKNYQLNYHLKDTGILDNNTVSQMMKPRCGVADAINNNNATATKSKNQFHNNRKLMSIHSSAHYSFFSGQPRWPAERSHLRYRFLSSTLQVPGTENIRSICARAFQKWAQVTHFTFEEVASNDVEAEIEIGFHTRSHGDGRPFDGMTGTLAHAFAPPHGLFHFDGDENWSQNPQANQVDLESIAVHEIGHLLGLHHSNDPNAVMFSTFDYGITKRDLASDDVQGIRALYGLQ